MYILFETSSGIAILKGKNKLENITGKDISLVTFAKYKNFKSTIKENLRISKGKVPKTLKKNFKKETEKYKEEKIAVSDKKLANAIKKKFDVDCVYGASVEELMRVVRGNIFSLVPVLKEEEIKEATTSLSHSMSADKIKFSTEKVDLMIIQSIALIDDLDKELNGYLMRIKEWYGWHFPELVRIVTDNESYVKTVKAIGNRKNESADLAGIVSDEIAEKIRSALKISMGTEIGDDDSLNIRMLCKQYLEINEYRTSLHNYLKERMKTIAPNLCELVGELIGARLIAKAGSLLDLAKCPASTIQIYGAEKSLFRALKTKGNSPKYGLIFHAKLIGKQPNKKKGKAARVLATKVALAARVDALSKNGGNLFSARLKERIERQMEQK